MSNPTVLDELQRILSDAEYNLNAALSRPRPATPEYINRLRDRVQRARTTLDHARSQTPLAEPRTLTWEERYPASYRPAIDQLRAIKARLKELT